MPVNLMFVVPHGTLITKNNSGVETVKGFNKINNSILNNNIDHFIIVDPHDKIYSNRFSFALSKEYSGMINGFDKKIYNGHSGINDELFNFVKTSDYQNFLQIININRYNLSWGALVPLHFLHTNQTMSLLSIDRKININAIKFIGYEIFNLLNQRQEKICIIFSCDLAHTHEEKNENAVVYDKHVFDVIKKSLIEDYNNIDLRILQSAQTDAHAQLTMLSSICSKIKYTSKVYSYEVPTYFGMLTAEINLDIKL